MSRRAKRKNSRRSKRTRLILIIVLAAAVILCVRGIDTGKSAEQLVQSYADRHNIYMSEYPDELIQLLASNRETKKFVLEYPQKKDLTPEIDLSGECDAGSVPRLLQWDQRWGYREYGDGIIGINGCGPTCLSMVYIYLTGDTSMNPYEMAVYSQNSGYYVNGTGTSWELMSSGASALGLDVTQIPLDKERIIANLEAGNPVICSMGPGKFTRTGHFIVLTGYKNNKFKVNDPNSKRRSQRKWNYDDIADSVMNIWVYRN